MQYPAMMVPQMVRALLEEIVAVFPEVKRVADPFVGSGTVLTETMLRGLEFYGRDVNPLAVLLCRTKAGPFFPEAAYERIDEALAVAKRDRSKRVEVEFPGQKKWFTSKALIALSRLRRAIAQEPSLWARRFLWVAMAETVRLTSNSRTSTFKLHIRPSKEILNRSASPLAIFENVVKANLRRYQSLADALRAQQHTSKGRYSKYVQVQLSDTRLPFTQEAATCDVVITSPPYGDNATTVPYGQYSYLPLQWIDLVDIGAEVSPAFLATTHAIDRRSLGGSRKRGAMEIGELLKVSQTLRRTLSALKDAPPDRAKRVGSFVHDLDLCLSGIDSMLKPGGIMVWVLGNRRVAGKVVRLDSILVELLATRNLSLVTSIRRGIPSKRMAHRNKTTKTMLSESIVVLRKGTTTQ